MIIREPDEAAFANWPGWSKKNTLPWLLR